MQDKKMKQELEREQAKSRLLMAMSGHIGEHNAVGMGELFQAVFGKPWQNRINDTRKLRKLVTDLRKAGIAIASTASQNGGGYYLANTRSELEDYCGRIEKAAKRKLMLAARIRKQAFPEYTHQLAIRWGAE